jgi:hypothetical protein
MCEEKTQGKSPRQRTKFQVMDTLIVNSFLRKENKTLAPANDSG